MKFKTALLFGFCIAALATAGPITFKFTIFESDTNGAVNRSKTPLPCCSPVLSTPITRTNAPAGFTVIGAATPQQIPAVFGNPLEEEVGIWFYNEPEWLASAANSALAADDLSTPIGQAFTNLTEGSSAMPAAAGTISISPLPKVAFQAAIAPSTTPASSSVTQTAPRALVPESSTFTLLMIGVGCLLIGKFRRKAT